jgi:alkylhydroperoxidase/carboxymuconolactone decarboxylase family protein YurZ
MSTLEEKGIPASLKEFGQKHSEVWRSYEALGDACHRAGPLDDKTRRLVKLALSVGARQEGGVRGQVRKARQAAIGLEELEHVVALAVPTLGLPNSIAAYSWIASEWTSTEGS